MDACMDVSVIRVQCLGMLEEEIFRYTNAAAVFIESNKNSQYRYISYCVPPAA